MKSKQILALLLALSMILGMCACASTGTEAASAEPTAQLSTQENSENGNTVSVDLSSGTPWLASSVQGAVTENTVAELKDDFYLYVNKDSILSYEFLPGYSNAGVLPQRDVENDRDILALFTDAQPTSHDAGLAIRLYELFLDWDSRNDLGVQPLKTITDAVDALSSIEEMNRYYTTVPFERQASLPFYFGTTIDYNDSNSYTMAVCPGTLMLDDSAEYSEMSELGQIMKREWSAFTLYLLQRLGYSQQEAETKLANSYALETLLAPSILTSEEWNDPNIIDRINNVISIEDFSALQGNVPILEVMDLCGIERKESLILMEPAWLEAFKGIYDDEHLQLLKDYVIVQTVLSFGEVLDRDCFITYTEAANAVSGTDGLLTDEQYAAIYAMNMLAMPVSRLYCETYFTPEDKQNVTALVQKILDAYSEMLMEEDFISDATKKKAVEKLESITINSLYPDDWSPYSYEELNLASPSEGGTLYESVVDISRFEYAKSAEDFTRPVDKTKWDGLAPTTVNAFYDCTANSVNLLAAFCRGDIYSSDMPLEEQYAKLGTVIAHEISHSFDGTGSQFDKDGNYANWWTAKDRAVFEKKIQAIADYADTVTCWDGTHINGSIITGETCADMGAMACMLHIAKSVEGFDYDLFFRSYASLWSYVRSYNEFLGRLKNEHPPEYFRVNGTLQQFEEFYHCYGITESDGMYLAPEKRVAIW